MKKPCSNKKATLRRRFTGWPALKVPLWVPGLLYAMGVQSQAGDQPLFRKDSLFQTLSERWELDPEHYLGNFRITPYKPTYIMLARWTSDTNRQPASFNPEYALDSPLDLDATELRFQISFKTKIARGFFLKNLDVWVAYTQKSHWQVYNADTSRPFRETNYEPELILNYGMRVPVLGFDLRMAGLSFNHQSNGRSLPLSRSWNRIIFHLAMERENWQVTLRPWIRIADTDDENPLIGDYYGRMEGIVTRQVGSHLITLEGTHSLKLGPDNRGSLRLGWVFPIDGFLRGHIELFEGYGETLIDYNHRQFTVGLGLSLVEWR